MKEKEKRVVIQNHEIKVGSETRKIISILQLKHLNMPAGDEDDVGGAVARPGGGN